MTLIMSRIKREFEHTHTHTKTTAANELTALFRLLDI